MSDSTPPADHTMTRRAKERLAAVKSIRVKRRFYYGRLSVLMAVFFAVAGWAAKDIHDRRARTEWTRTLSVAIVVAQRGEVDPAATSLVRQRIDALAGVLHKEFQRYRPDAFVPFRFKVYGPTDVAGPPPDLEDDTVVSLLSYTYERWRYLSQVNDSLGLSPSQHDSVVYLVVRPPASAEYSFVEGASEEGGRVGLVDVELDRHSVDTALFVVAHELFHTLGAKDKYDSFGRTLIPKGLAEPDLVPLFPQKYAELMARNVVYAPDDERPPSRVEQIRVGPDTAREILWKRKR